MFISQKNIAIANFSTQYFDCIHIFSEREKEKKIKNMQLRFFTLLIHNIISSFNLTYYYETYMFKTKISITW